MPVKLRIAICQFPVSCNIASNAKYIRRFMQEAADAESHVVQFPETALSGYGRLNFRPLSPKDWRTLEAYTAEIVDLAGNLGLWVVLGSSRRATAKKKPANCIQVISNRGRIVGTYDKQELAPKEANWYTPGEGFLVITINGMKCGLLICYEACFPALFETYRKKGVQLIFHCCHNVSRKPKSELEELALAQIRTRAADNQMWILDSNSSARYSFSRACVARPDGSVRSLKKHVAGILLHDFPDQEIGWTYDNRKKKSNNPLQRRP